MLTAEPTILHGLPIVSKTGTKRMKLTLQISRHIFSQISRDILVRDPDPNVQTHVVLVESIQKLAEVSTKLAPGKVGQLQFVDETVHTGELKD